jgi:hypothetical protein
MLPALIDGIACTSLAGLRLALKDRDNARMYYSECLQRYRELMRLGLPRRDPLRYVIERGWASWNASSQVRLPVYLDGGGGTRPEEVLVLATVTRLLQPKKIFEIGTYRGLTTCAFILNAPARSVYSIDLPPDEPHCPSAHDQIDTDLELINQRRLAHHVHELHLEEPVHADSLQLTEIRAAATRGICGTGIHRWRPYAAVRDQRHGKDGRHGGGARARLLARLRRPRSLPRTDRLPRGSRPPSSRLPRAAHNAGVDERGKPATMGGPLMHR